jgi:hypothetical protein
MPLKSIVFHAVIDDTRKTFTMDGPGDPNGVRLHYEVVRAARQHGRNLRQLDIRAASLEAAVVEARAFLSGYAFSGPWSA